MLVIDCFNHNIYVGDDLIGYIGENELVVHGKKFADLTDDGKIIMNNKVVAYVDDDGSIIVKGKEAGYIDDKNNFVFMKGKLL